MEKDLPDNAARHRSECMWKVVVCKSSLCEPRGAYTQVAHPRVLVEPQDSDWHSTDKSFLRNVNDSLGLM